MWELYGKEFNEPGLVLSANFLIEVFSKYLLLGKRLVKG